MKYFVHLVSAFVSSTLFWSKLHELAAISNDLTKAEVLEQIGSDISIDDVDKHGQTPLILACLFNNTPAVRAFLEAGADVNKPDMLKRTPLILASSNGFVSVVEALLDRNAQIDLVDQSGQTALFAASKDGHLRVVKALLKAKANVDLPEQNGTTPLHVASSAGRLLVVMELIKANASVNSKSLNGETPLHAAIVSGMILVLNQLICAGANLYNVDGRGKTYLEVAREFNRPKIAQYLIGVHKSKLRVVREFETQTCRVCFESYERNRDLWPVLLPCNVPNDENQKIQCHVICRRCVEQILYSRPHPRCPNCRKSIFQSYTATDKQEIVF